MFEEITQKTPFSALRCEHFFFFFSYDEKIIFPIWEEFIEHI
jgi:hypothetical protein